MNKTYLLPTKIITSEGSFLNLNSILESEIDQPSFQFKDNLILDDNGGFIVLDFGKEISGGLRIVNQGVSNQNLIHIRFGESVSEVMFNIGEKNSTNDHSPREFDYLLPNFSKVEFGDTGFRFVRIDFPKGVSQRIYSIHAISKEIDYEMFGSFTSDNEELNKIFEVATRTAKLCVLDYIVDGIKRDRLVWAGDLLVELKSLNYLYGVLPEVEKTLLFLEETNPMPTFIQNMPTYSMWYLACVNEYFKMVGFNSFVKQRKEYIELILKLADAQIRESGEIDFEGVSNVSFPYFIDWRTSQEKDVAKSNPCFYLYLINECKTLLNKLGLDVITNKIINKLIKYEPQLLNVSQFDCFTLLTNKGNKTEIIESILKSRESQFSPFSYYFVVSSLFNNKPEEALEMFKNYNMGMINLGATTFFEEFDYSWLNSTKIDELPSSKFNFLTDTGKDCYIGLRKSLCHGWASGPVSFIIENIVGFKGIEENEIILKPNTSLLNEFNASFMCKLGLVKVSFKNDKFSVNVPAGITYKLIK